MKKRFAEIVGGKYCLDKKEDVELFVRDRRNRLARHSALVLLPKNVGEICEIMKCANKNGIAIIPQGGNTGLVGGGIPVGDKQVILSMRRLNKILKIDGVGNTMTVEAGVVLGDMQKHAEGVDRFFPLALGAQGSCCIGGNVSTNAGGTNVLSYGNTRDLVLGLEVVMADGEIVDMISELRKNNAGIDLKNMFIGAEGTLGVITKAVVKIFPMPRNVVTIFMGVDDLEMAFDVFGKLRDRFDRNLTAFEVINQNGMLATLDGKQNPVGQTKLWYLLVEICGEVEEVMDVCMVENCVVARSIEQRKNMWKLRHELSDAQKIYGASIKSDIALPLAKLPKFR